MSSSLRVRSLSIPRRELRWRFSRSGGPGGQSVNTADSRVELSFDVARSTALPEPLRQRALARLADRLVDGVLTVSAQEHRAQIANRRAAEQRLVEVLDQALAPPPRSRRVTRPTRGSVRRRLDAKQQRSRTKQLRRRPTD
ncbi:MAG: aminoacyl-tRNA hydrolase [Nocardioidaceae bacterium]|jgi:ribosome-associated protein|nr:aminoacyl-tRNA hydrolase [Nocardioidaceae bacterium]